QQNSLTIRGAGRLHIDSLIIFMSHSSSTGPSTLSLHDALPIWSDAQSIGGNAVLALLAGNYTLSVSANGDSTGGYQFRLFDLATATALTPGTPVSEIGRASCRERV